MYSPLIRLVFIAAVIIMTETQTRRHGWSLFRPTTYPSGVIRPVGNLILVVAGVMVLTSLADLVPTRFVPLHRFVDAGFFSAVLFGGLQFINGFRQSFGERLTDFQQQFLRFAKWFWMAVGGFGAVVGWLSFLSSIIR